MLTTNILINVGQSLIKGHNNKFYFGTNHFIGGMLFFNDYNSHRCNAHCQSIRFIFPGYLWN